MQNRITRGFLLLVCLGFGYSAFAADLASLCTDRTAIERVYYNHRLGEKPAFEQILPPAAVEKLVRQDLRKEAALKRTYGIEITPAVLEAEVQRVNTTTHSPEVLAELKAALGNDPARFARSIARPILVERTLRARFENDDKLHVDARKIAESARDAAIKMRTSGIEKQITAIKESNRGQVSDTTWQLAARTEADANQPSSSAEQTKGVVKSVSYSIEATAQVAQVVSGARKENEKSYFEDLAPELQNVLRAQMQKTGDVSAVIETPGAFLVFVCEEKSAAILRTASLSVPKRSYEEWLAQQPD